MINALKNGEAIPENTERHPVHLFITEKEVEMYFNMFDERIKRLESLLQRTKDTVYESNVKKDMKVEELSNKLSLVTNMYAEFREQTVW